MLELATGVYSAEAVHAALTAPHRELRYEYALLDKNDVFMGWLDDVSGSVSLDAAAEVKRTASFTLTRQLSKDVDLSSERIQPYFKLHMPDGGWASWPLGVYLLSSPVRQAFSTDRIRRSITAYDKTQILKEDKFTGRHVVAAGTPYVAAIGDILAGAGIERIRIPASGLTLPAAAEFEIGSDKIKAVNTLLAAINYNSLYFDVQGWAVAEPYVEPEKRDIAFAYRTNEISVILPEATESLDLFSLPNIFVRYVSNPDAGELRSVYTNDNPTSILSTAARGRNIVDVQNVDDIADQATLDALTRRAAIEASQVYGGVEFQTASMPHHDVLDCLFVEHDQLGVSGAFVEQGWEMELSREGTMRHTCKQVVRMT